MFASIPQKISLEPYTARGFSTYSDNRVGGKTRIAAVATSAFFNKLSLPRSLNLYPTRRRIRCHQTGGTIRRIHLIPHHLKARRPAGSAHLAHPSRMGRIAHIRESASARDKVRHPEPRVAIG
jgi:hypothetical protein